MSSHVTDDFRIAIIVNPALPVGFLANTVAAIGIGIGAGETGFGAVRLCDRGGTRFLTSSNRPVPILQANNATLQALLQKARQTEPQDGNLVIFPAFARSLHRFEDYESAVPLRDLADEEIDGAGLFGPAKWVKSLTGSLKLLR